MPCNNLLEPSDRLREARHLAAAPAHQRRGLAVLPHARPGGRTIYRLVLWNIDLTLVDVARVSRDAYAEAFRRVTGRPLVALPQVAGRSDSEIFFESLALNDIEPDVSEHGSQEHTAGLRQ